MTMITKILNNDYVLNKIMSFLGVVLVLLGFTSCGDEDEIDPSDGVILYGTPGVRFAVRGEVAGLVTDSIGNPVSNIHVRVNPVYQNGERGYADNLGGLTDEDGKYTTEVMYGYRLSENDTTDSKIYFPKYRAIATDSTGVYDNDTLYIDYVLEKVPMIVGEMFFDYTSSATANFTLHKKKN